MINIEATTYDKELYQKINTHKNQICITFSLYYNLYDKFTAKQRHIITEYLDSVKLEDEEDYHNVDLQQIFQSYKNNITLQELYCEFEDTNNSFYKDIVEKKLAHLSHFLIFELIAKDIYYDSIRQFNHTFLDLDFHYY